MKTILPTHFLAVLLLVPVLGSAQWSKSDERIFDRSGTAFNPKGKYHVTAIKGAVIPALIGNGGLIASYIGVEYGFTKNQSIGVDGFFMFGGGSHDMVTDTAGVKHDVGNRYSGTERAIFLNYRYYFNFKKLRENHGIILYTSCFGRYGKMKNYQDEAYRNDYITKEETHKSVGLLLGSVFMFGGSERWAWDVNAGPFIKQKEITTVYRENSIKKAKFEDPSTTGIRFGLMFNYFFFR